MPPEPPVTEAELSALRPAAFPFSSTCTSRDLSDAPFRLALTATVPMSPRGATYCFEPIVS
ncbi:hypothetical protein HaLaN_03950 [Haematococcus lacustris]|uniref:Uncharacterized protein n=1 Tax=Haematococcus lacustris TaxID=44745 RepID=A0A699YM16_HAELA|nr:hypothetical protein HaLaN_03950 [Haematococcus lacustris]